MPEKFKRIKPKKASDLIIKEIWNLILKGELKPGDKLPPERELGKRFGVSMVTLREALQTLEAYGHISKKRGVNGGSVVLDIAPTKGINLLVEYLNSKKYSVEALIEAKTLIDPIIGEVANKRLNQKGKKALKALIEEHEKDFETRGASKCGWKYYTLIGELSGNPIFAVIAELLTRLLIDLEFSIGISDLESPEEQDEYNRSALESHVKVVEAFTSGNSSEVKTELQRNARCFARVLGGIYAKQKRRSHDIRPLQ